MKNRSFRRWLTLALVLAMLLGILPAAVAADASLSDYAPAGTTNLAVDAMLTVSNGTHSQPDQENSYEKSDESWCKAFVHDGVLDGRGFSTNPFDAEPDENMPVVLTFDLGKRCSVSKFGVFARTDAIFPTDYQIETSLDGKTWSVAAEQTGAPKVPTEPYFYVPDNAVEARYVRLNVTKRYAQDSIGAGTGNDGKLVQLQEFAIWGTVVQESGGDEKPTGTKYDIASWALDGTTNIALNKKVSVSSDYIAPEGIWAGTQLNDGYVQGIKGYNGANGWTTSPFESAAADTPAWAAINLGASYEISRIVVFPRSDLEYANNFPVDYVLQASDDGKTWTDLLKVTDQVTPDAPVCFDLDAAVTTKNVRIYVTKRGGAMVQLSELAVFGTPDRYDLHAWQPEGTENAALKKPVTVSSDYIAVEGIWGSMLLNDGYVRGVVGFNGANGWTTLPSEGTSADKAAYASIDLGLTYELSRFVIFPRSDDGKYGYCFPIDYQLQVSLDGNNWTDAAKVTGQKTPTAPVCFDLEEPVEASYVRLYVTKRAYGANDGYYIVQLSELAAFGTLSANNFAVDVSKNALELAVGESDSVKVTVTAVDELDHSVSWASEDPDVASVDETGVITANAVGSTTITATVANSARSENGENIRKEISVTVVEKKFSFDDNILISIFWPPTSEYMDKVSDDSLWDEQYKLMADAGINFVNNVTGNDLNSKETNLKMAKYANKYGMHVSVADSRFGGNLMKLTAEQIRSLIDEYRNVPGVAGYYILDEPSNANPYNAVHQAMKQADPDGYMHLNFLPAWAYATLEQAKDQMNDYLKLNAAGGYPQDYLMYDLYPYPDNSTAMNRSGFLGNMRAVWEVGRENDVKTANYLQSVRIPGSYRAPSASEIRYEAMMGLAFGYKQFSYFTWFTPSERSEPFADGIILLDGTPNPKSYEAVKQLNSEIHALGTTLAKLNAEEIYLNGETWGDLPIPEGFFAQGVDSTNFTVSYLKEKNGTQGYMMLVNNDYTDAATIRVKLDSAITSLKRVSAQDGTLSDAALSGGELTVTLAAGDGALYQLPAGYVYESGKEENDNLALDANVYADSSEGGNGWYISKLNDGVREPENANNGWKSVGTQQAVITADLRESKTFNRVDLYPAAGEMGLVSAGQGMPKDFTIEVSQDGKSWTVVYTAADKTMENGVAYSITFDARTARYLRVNVAATNSTYCAISELEIYNDDGTIPAPKPGTTENEVVHYEPDSNLLLNKKYYVSSTTPDGTYKQWGWAAEYLNDGLAQTGNGWTSNVGVNHDEATSHEWCAFDMGDLFAVNKVRIYGGSSFAFPVDYRVQVSLDGTTWTDVAVKTNDPGTEGWREIEFDAQTARFVRVYGDKLVDKGRDGYLMQIGEVEAYGTPVVDRDAANAALEARKAARAKITGEDTTALDAAIKALEDAIADENSTQSETNALIRAADAELAKFTVSTAEAAAALVEAKNAVSGGSLRLVSEKTMNALQNAIDALEAGIAAAGDTVYQTELNTLTENVKTALAAARSEQDANEQPVIPVTPKPSKPNAADNTPKFPFVDVPSASWYYDSVREAWENGLIDGVTANEFRPDNQLTVAQAIKLAAALHQMQKTGSVTLTNGAPNWYDSYVAYAVNNGIIEKDYLNYTKAQMDAPATRGEFVHIFSGALVDAAAINTVADDKIPDVKTTDKYGAEIYKFYRAGITIGSDALGTFHPASNIKRSEVAAIVLRMFDTAARKGITLK